MSEPVDAGSEDTRDGSAAVAFCGDGRVDPGEACDDGDDNSDSTPGACRTTCQPAGCDDGVVDPGLLCLGRTFLLQPGEVRPAGDSNGDGIMDFVIRSDGRFELHLSDGSDWSSAWSAGEDSEPIDWIVSNLDDDDRADLLVIKPDAVETRLGTADGFGPSRVDSVPVAAVLWHYPFDDDNLFDLLVQTSTDLVILRNDGSGRFSAAGSVPLNGGRFAGIADVDGDGHADILLDRPAGRFWSKLSSDGALATPELLSDQVLFPIEIDGTQGREFFTVAPPGFTMTFLDYDGSALVPIAGPTMIQAPDNWFDADGDGLHEALSIRGGQLSVFDLPSGEILDSRAGAGFPRPTDLDADEVWETTLVQGVEYLVFEQSDERLLGDPSAYSLDVPAQLSIRYGGDQRRGFFSIAGGLGLTLDAHARSAVVQRDVDAHQIERLDVDSDGIDDVLMATTGGDLLVGRSDGLGGFELGTPQLVGLVERFATSDLDGDGRTDLIAAAGDMVRIALQVGDGTFEVRTETTAGTQIENIAAGDFDGDGLVDVAVAPGIGAVRILLGQAGLDLSAAATSSVSASALYSAQLDEDPGDELLLLHRADETLTLRRPDGTMTEVATAPEPRIVISADLDGDDRPEVIVAARRSIQIFDRDLELMSSVEVLGGHHLVAGDLDGDGDTDLLTAAPMGEATMLTEPDDYGLATPLLNDGGRFEAGRPFYTRGPPRSVFLADTNGDGALDLVAATHGAPIPTAYTPWEPALVTYLGRP